MKYEINLIDCDIAPLQGRQAFKRWRLEPDQDEMIWEGAPFSLWGEADAFAGQHVIRVQGSIRPRDESAATPGWIELETMAGDQEPAIEDLFLGGTRPLPCLNLTCICRHPLSPDYLVAAAADGRLLLLEARLSANLKILTQQPLPAALSALVCCGKMLLGLEKTASSESKLHPIRINNTSIPYPAFRLCSTIRLPIALTALAENDSTTAWGATDKGELFLLKLNPVASRFFSIDAHKSGCLKGRTRQGSLTTVVKEVCQTDKTARFFRRAGRCSGLAYDGRHFWSFWHTDQKPSILRLHDKDGTLLRLYSCHAQVAVSSLNYCHHHLLVLDQEHQQLHLYYSGDTMEAVAGLAPLNDRHPGYLAAGAPEVAGMHELCLLYVGAEGQNAIHRYDPDKLLPLLAYLSREGVIKDYFMDGFLLLAQYSPLLNGRSFGTDLTGPPSRKEDWLALFDEYFHPRANLCAMEASAAAIIKKLGISKSGAVKVVLCIPTADPRCTDWDAGYSLAEESHRIEATRWAMQELVERWRRAGFHHLKLAGFYYMTEQGLYNDGVLHAFPRLCKAHGLRSFAIPGITSSWMTEFNRAGFDGVALQPSHAFWQPVLRPRRYLLKCAGHIARHYGMGMEVELPYDVGEPAGRQRLRDYLEMAVIQGWAGAFTAYFQSYNLIKSLAESTVPECRRLYDDLFHFSRLSRRQTVPVCFSNRVLKVDCRASWNGNEAAKFRLNIEGHQGVFHLRRLESSD